QFLGGDKLVSWSSKKQDCTSMSSAEAEYVSLSACYAQVLWMRTQLTDYGFHFDKIPIEDGNPARANVKQALGRGSYALSWKLCQGDSLNLPDHRGEHGPRTGPDRPGLDWIEDQIGPKHKPKWSDLVWVSSVRSGSGQSGLVRSSVRSGPTRHNRHVFCKSGPDLTED
nr:retrovirus-related Pol polyprotein from transposon TNT 1-94 [Tanacetum cinerariifolium]